VQILVASLIAPASFCLAKVVTRDAPAAFFAACWIAIIPAVILLAPSFDQWYPLLACGIIGTWIRTIETGRIPWAVGCGAVLSIAVFFSYSMLTLGALMALAAVAQLASGRSVRSIAISCAIVIATVAAVYGGLSLFTGFNPLATFAQAWNNQREWEAQFAIPRVHPATIPGDLQDFFLGSAWISALIILFWLLGLRQRDNRAILVLLCLIQPLIVAATGLLQCETARVWSFMQPLVLIPVGIELARWTNRARLTAFACLFILLVVQGRNFIFQY